MNFWGLKDDKKIRKLRFEALRGKNLGSSLSSDCPNSD